MKVKNKVIKMLIKKKIKTKKTMKEHYKQMEMMIVKKKAKNQKIKIIKIKQKKKIHY